MLKIQQYFFRDQSYKLNQHFGQDSVGVMNQQRFTIDKSIQNKIKHGVVLKNRNINNWQDVKIHPAFGGTYVIQYEDINKRYHLQHILTDGDFIKQLQSQNTFDFKMINQRQLLYVKIFADRVQICSLNLQDEKQNKLIHKHSQTTTYGNFIYFSETQNICIEETYIIKGQNKNSYMKCFTYYKYPFTEQENKPINQYSFSVEPQNQQNQYKQHFESNYKDMFQLDLKSKFMHVEHIWGKTQKIDPSQIVKNVKYRICDQNGFRIYQCKFVNFSQLKYFHPINMMQIKPGTLYIKFRCQLRARDLNSLLVYHDKHHKLHQPFGQMKLIQQKIYFQESKSYETLWNYEQNRYDALDFMNTSNQQIQFLTGVGNLKQTQRNLIRIVNPSNYQTVFQIPNQKKNKKINRFYKFQFDNKDFYSYYLYHGNIGLNATYFTIQTIVFKKEQKDLVELYNLPDTYGVSFIRKPRQNIYPINL